MQTTESLYTASYGKHVSQKKGYPDFRNRLRIKLFIPFVAPQAEQSILEIGCNDGMFLREVGNVGVSVYGVDVNEAIIASQHDPRLKVMSGTALQFPDSSFDTVYSFEVIEHVPEIKSYFSEVSRVLKKHGKLVVSFPFELFRGMTAIGDAIHSYGNPLMCRELHVHKLSPEKVTEFIEGTALHIESSRVLFAPFPTYLMILSKQ